MVCFHCLTPIPRLTQRPTPRPTPMELALIVMCRTVSTEPTPRPMYVPIPIPMATVPIFATDIGAINQLQLHFCCVLLFSPSANVVCTLVKMLGSHIYHRKQACRQQRIHRMKLFIMYMMFEMQMVHREVWIHPLNVERSGKGEFYRLYLDQRHFPEKFFGNYCMSTHQFDDILNKIDPLVRKKDTNFRKAITPEEKLALTLR